MSIVITATVSSAPSGAGKIVAKCNGKQKSTRTDLGKSVNGNFGAAVGALLDTMLTPEQRSKMLHPSAKGRCVVESLSDAGGKQRWTIAV